jgi:hypothetical protein
MAISRHSYLRIRHHWVSKSGLVVRKAAQAQLPGLRQRLISGDAQEPVPRLLLCDGNDLEFYDCSKLFVTIRYTSYTYSATNLDVAECDPLLFALICRNCCGATEKAMLGSH